MVPRLGYRNESSRVSALAVDEPLFTIEFPKPMTSNHPLLSRKVVMGWWLLLLKPVAIMERGGNQIVAFP